MDSGGLEASSVAIFYHKIVPCTYLFATEQFFSVWLYNLDLNPDQLSAKGLDPGTDSINMDPKIETHEKSIFFCANRKPLQSLKNQ
jgi:hypothetical protein